MKQSTNFAVLMICSIIFYISCKKPDQAEPNTAPVVDAGKDGVVLLPDDFISFKGAFSDNDATPATFIWTILPESSYGSYLIYIENPTELHTKVSRLTAGKYLFQLAVTDKAGLTGKDTVEVEVLAAWDVVSAGKPQVILLPITKGILTGRTVLPADSILKKEWTKISGPNATILSPNEWTSEIINLEDGEYIFELAVTTKANFTRKSQCTVSVFYPGGPEVYFGFPPYELVYLPTDFTTLTAWARSNYHSQSPVTKTEWTKISGPSGLTIETPLNNITKISGLQQGVYELKFKATDQLGKSTLDSITVAVVDTLTPNQEVTIPDKPWISGGGGFACNYLEEIKLDQYIPAGKPIKKVFIKTTCEPYWVEVKMTDTSPNGPVYQYWVKVGKLIVEYCNAGCWSDQSPDIKIVY